MTFPGPAPRGSADPGSRDGTPAAADPSAVPPVPPVPPGAPDDPAATGTGPGHGLVPPAAARRRQTPPADAREHAEEDGADAAPLLDRNERDRLAARLHQAVSGFVDEPRRAVEQADDVFDEAAHRLEQALAERRRALREPWRDGHGPGGREEVSGEPADSASGAETEQLRLALRGYRQATERLLTL